MGDEHGNFAEGQEMEHGEGEHHQGDFAEGQERSEHTGHDEHHGNFAAGQEMEHGDETHEDLALLGLVQLHLLHHERLPELLQHRRLHLHPSVPSYRGARAVTAQVDDGATTAPPSTT